MGEEADDSGIPREIVVHRLLNRPMLHGHGIEMMLETNFGHVKLRMSTEVAQSIVEPLRDELLS